MSEERVAIVTGAASGIGRTIAEHFAAQGMRVLFADRDGAGAEAAAKGVAKGAAIEVDVRSPEDCARMVDFAVQTWGRVDAAVAAAGIHGGGPSIDLRAEDFTGLIDVNLNGVFFTAQAAGRAIVAGGRGGSVVLVGSAAGRAAFANRAAYCVSKAGVAMLGKCLALEWVQHRVNVNTVCPGIVNAPMVTRSHTAEQIERAAAAVPMGRLAEPTEIAALAWYLSSRDAAYITGAGIVIDGGWTLSADASLTRARDQAGWSEAR